jgi:hypothetical protein
LRSSAATSWARVLSVEASNRVAWLSASGFGGGTGLTLPHGSCATRASMHPLIARFLDLPAAITALEKEETESTLDSEESAFLAAATAFPKARAAILKARGSKNPSAEAQQQLIILATRAATTRISIDPMLGPRVTSARAALVTEGASNTEADDLIAQAVLEEAFGYAEDPEVFDATYLAETLDSLAFLARVTQETVDDWLENFARAGVEGDRALRLKVAEVLLESAWSEGPQPITPEHLDEAVELLADTVADTEFEKAASTLGSFLGFLAAKQVVGPLRKARLQQVLDSATSGGAESEDDDESSGDEDE